MLLAPTKDVNIIYKYIMVNMHASQSAIYLVILMVYNSTNT